MNNDITAAQMRAQLEAEFLKLRPAACKTCVPPKTFWGPAAGPGSGGYWYMEQANACPHGCRQIMAQVWAKITSDNNVGPPDDVRVSKYTRVD
jgi:hypothetical protein